MTEVWGPFLGFVKRQDRGPVAGHYARPAETPCLSCGRSDQWEDAYHGAEALLRSRIYYCACGDGMIDYANGVEQWVFADSYTRRPYVQTGGRAWWVAHAAWTGQRPEEYERPARTVATTCPCGTVLTAQEAGWDEVGQARYSETCACGVLVELTVPLARRPTYSDELVAWEAQEPPCRREPLRWVGEDVPREGVPPCD